MVEAALWGVITSIGLIVVVFIGSGEICTTITSPVIGFPLGFIRSLIPKG